MAYTKIFRLALGVALIGLPCAAMAQTVDANAASYNAGYGRYNGQENRVASYTTRDANNNRVIVDGVMMTGADQSVYSRTDTGGAYDSYSGVGGTASSSAIGNSLTVVTQGNYNTVIIDSHQTNTGTVTAQTNAAGAN
jgi:holdfast attachment protein HfaA